MIKSDSDSDFGATEVDSRVATTASEYLIFENPVYPSLNNLPISQINPAIDAKSSASKYNFPFKNVLHEDFLPIPRVFSLSKSNKPMIQIIRSGSFDIANMIKL